MRELTLNTNQQQTSHIFIGRGLRPTIEQYIEDLNPDAVLYVTQEPLVKVLNQYLGSKDDEVIALPAGEDQKDMSNVLKILKKLQSQQADKNSLVVSFGGGVISDMSGFAAAIYKRGVKFISIPTTLLGMVDAAVGGKNGVNFEGIKNSVGTIYNPPAIFADIDLLETLPENDVLSGVGELIKMAICRDRELFELMEQPIDDNLEEIIGLGITNKIKIVESDPFESSGVRFLLNFGHTLGHALESASDYKLAHGLAVAVGCNFAAFVSREKGYISDDDYQKVRSAISALKLPIYVDFSVEDILRYMRGDKKRLDPNQISFVLIRSIGEGFVEPLSFTEIEKYLTKFKEAES